MKSNKIGIYLFLFAVFFMLVVTMIYLFPVISAKAQGLPIPFSFIFGSIIMLFIFIIFIAIMRVK